MNPNTNELFQAVQKLISDMGLSDQFAAIISTPAAPWDDRLNRQQNLAAADEFYRDSWRIEIEHRRKDAA